MTYGPDLQFTWGTPTRVVFGPGKLATLGAAAAGFGAGRALIVTDPHLAGQAGIVGRAVDSLREAGLAVEVFSGIASDPSVEAIDAGREVALAFKPDLFVGIGGGSSMDAAKLIDMVYVCGDAVLDHQGANTVSVPLLPVIAVPTTAGTGSETSIAAVVSDHARQVKVPLAERAFTPRLAILDPELTLGLPPRLTAATGMDAYAHAVDVLHSTRRQPFNDAFAIHCIRTVERYLRRAYTDPGDITARGQVLAAACSMGFALSTTTYGIIHALGHPLGAHCGVHHGVSVALLSPHGMRWNLDAATDIYADTARGAGIAPAGGGDRKAAEMLVDATERLLVDLDLPRTLREVGATEDVLTRMSEDAAVDYGARFNLRRPEGPAELELVYRAAF